MKKFRKIMAVLVAAMMIISSFTLTAWADPVADGKVTIDNPIAGEKYSLYKIFDLTYGTGLDGTHNTVSVPTTDSQVAIDGTYTPVAYTYTAETPTDAFLTALQASNLFDVTLIQTTTNVYNVAKKDAATSQQIIDWLKNTGLQSLPANRQIGTEVTAQAGQSVVWSSLKEGYYYATSTAGSLFTIDSTMNEVIVKEKNIIPTSVKEVQNSKTNGWGNDDNAEIGDTVNFRIVVTDGKGTNKAITVHDKMSEHLTLKQNSFSVTVDGNPVDTSNYKIFIDKNLSVDTSGTEIPVDKSIVLSSTPAIFDGTTHPVDDDTFVIIFKADYINTLKEGKNIIIQYSAVLNQGAAVDTLETNFSKISYSNQTSAGNTVNVHTYDVDILKFRTGQPSTPIADAVFQLQNNAGTRIWLKKSANIVSNFDVYEVAQNQTFSTDGLTEVYDSRDSSILIGYKDGQDNMVYYNAFVTTANNKVRIIGLDVDETSYNLEELEAPNGFYRQTQKTVITPSGNPLNFADISVENKTTTELPATGGMGTTVLYIVGGMLVILAGAYLFFSRKKTA